VIFYVGLHQECDAHHFERCMVSVNRLVGRVSDFAVGDWMMDSGAFSQIKDHGRFLESPEEYAQRVIRWSTCGNLKAAVSQDYMCEPFILGITGLTTLDHQRLTIERYDAILEAVGRHCYVLPVLQGYWPDEYQRHLEMYGERLRHGQWVGVGSVCKRNADVESIEQVLMAVKVARPDLRLHGFGVKLTALASSVVRGCLATADSMAWSYSARKQGRDGNDWHEAQRFVRRIEEQEVALRHFQTMLF
jgi:hypothetical protein